MERKEKEEEALRPVRADMGREPRAGSWPLCAGALCAGARLDLSPGTQH